MSFNWNVEPEYSCCILKQLQEVSASSTSPEYRLLKKNPISFLYKGGYCIELSASVMKSSWQAHKVIFIQHVNRLCNSHL